MIQYVSIAQVFDIHADQSQRYGGAAGPRDRGALESALARPAMTFGGEDLYPDVASKAAAVMHSLALNHPFLDGNKRVAAHVAVLFVMINSHELTASPDGLFEITMRVAEGKIQPEALAIWFRQRLRATD